MPQSSNLSKLLSAQQNDPLFETIEFHRMVDSYIIHLKELYKDTFINITNKDRLQFSGKLLAFMKHNNRNLDLKYMYLIMRLNDLTNPNDFLPSIEAMPDTEMRVRWFNLNQVDRIYSEWRTLQAKKK